MATIENGIYFFHIPKTAGVSIWKCLDQAFPAEEICPWWVWDQMVGVPTEILNRWSVFRGHFLSHLEGYLHRPLRTFTLLREPVERTVSHYYHTRRAPEHPFHEAAKSMSLREYCLFPATRPTVENFQAAYLAKSPCDVTAISGVISPEGRKRFELQEILERPDSFGGPEELFSAACRRLATFTSVGITERFSDSLPRIGRALGVTLSPVSEPQNVNPERVSLEPVDAGTLAVIQELTDVDRRLYEIAKRRFEEVE